MLLVGHHVLSGSYLIRIRFVSVSLFIIPVRYLVTRIVQNENAMIYFPVKDIEIFTILITPLRNSEIKELWKCFVPRNNGRTVSRKLIDFGRN